MSKQDEILGKHPAEHPCLGVWLDYEDKEGTDTSWIRVLSEKATFNQQINDWFANKTTGISLFAKSNQLCKNKT